MKIHEYQAKQLFAQFNVIVPEGYVATTVEDAVAVAQRLSTPKVVVKAQIHAGGRGKGGGVKVVDKANVAEADQAILGMQLVLVEEASNIARELYLAIVLDRATARPVLMASTEGGMDIEEVAAHTPEKIVKIGIHPSLGLQAFQVRDICFALGLNAPQAKQASQLINGLYALFVAKDASLVEINPLVVTADDRVLALDGKVNIDDNALFRLSDVAAMRDTDEEDPLEVEASTYHLNYIKLEGDVGCMVNGAGLAMATMDMVQLAGASAANFLDVGGGANEEAIENAFRILISDSSVKVVLINIFGGILRCDLLAQGVVKAANKLNMTLPLVIRMKGTNVEEGKAILKASSLTFTLADTLEEAAQATMASLKTAVPA
jgi:succinyl-CoA synthetase beta subunit